MDASDVGVLVADDRSEIPWLSSPIDRVTSSGGWQRFAGAVWLLHKHFLPDYGWVFVERAIARPPQTPTTPIERAAYSLEGLQGVSVWFDTKVTDGVGLVGMEFACLAHFGSEVPISADDENVLVGACRAPDRSRQDRSVRYGHPCPNESWAFPRGKRSHGNLRQTAPLAALHRHR